jgi:hypothetical protein
MRISWSLETGFFLFPGRIGGECSHEGGAGYRSDIRARWDLDDDQTESTLRIKADMGILISVCDSASRWPVMAAGRWGWRVRVRARRDMEHTTRPPTTTARHSPHSLLSAPPTPYSQLPGCAPFRYVSSLHTHRERAGEERD